MVCLSFLYCQSVGEEKGPPMEERLDFSESSDNYFSLSSSADRTGFQWINIPKNFGFDAEGMFIESANGTDFFNNPENGDVATSAPFYFVEHSNDFVATALVQPDFASQWNAVSLMVYSDSSHWIKFAFENSDATGKSIVSVVTREVSDDANGVQLNTEDAIWLRIIRKNDLYAMHYSTDGLQYKMARLAQLKTPPKIRIGIEAQSPVGPTVRHRIPYFSIEQKTVADLRKGE